MLREISGEISYIAEGIALLKHLGVGENYADYKESLSKKYAIVFREGLPKFELLGRIEQNAANAFREDMDEIRYYFSIYGESEAGSDTIHCAGTLALLWEFHRDMDFEDITALRKYLDGLTEKEYCEKFGIGLQSYADFIQIQEEDKISKIEEPFAIISYLMKMDLKDEEKWKLQKIFCDRTEHRERVLALIEKAIIILKNFRTELEKAAGQFRRYWTKTLDGRTFAAYLREEKEIEIAENTLGFCISPSIISFSSISMYTKYMDKTDKPKEITPNIPDSFRIGILFDEDFPIQTSAAGKDSAYENYAIQVLKLLSDKSKFEILSYIRNKEAYGSELAKHLNLTTATVSHHMNALLAARLVSIKRVDNRAYYLANKKALEEVLSYCRKILLDKD